MVFSQGGGGARGRGGWKRGWGEWVASEKEHGAVTEGYGELGASTFPSPRRRVVRLLNFLTCQKYLKCMIFISLVSPVGLERGNHGFSSACTSTSTSTSTRTCPPHYVIQQPCARFKPFQTGSCHVCFRSVSRGAAHHPSTLNDSKPLNSDTP